MRSWLYLWGTRLLSAWHSALIRGYVSDNVNHIYSGDNELKAGGRRCQTEYVLYATLRQGKDVFGAL